MPAPIMLASDDNNPEFAGAKNPDDALHVEFYDYAAVDDWETQQTGKRVLKKECPFVRINIPGNNLNIIERPADARDVNRFPRQWLLYQMQTGKIANATNVPGWPIDDWMEIDENLKHRLRFMRFTTVEQLAGASDGQIQDLGMGGHGFRQKAQDAIKRRNKQEVAEAVKERDEQIKAQAEQLSTLQAQMQELLKRIPAAVVDQPTEEVRRGPGRPPKTVEAAA